MPLYHFPRSANMVPAEPPATRQTAIVDLEADVLMALTVGNMTRAAAYAQILTALACAEMIDPEQGGSSGQ